jgi:glycine oxidase
VSTGVEALGVSIDAGHITAVHTTIGELRPGNVVFATGLPPRLEGLPLDAPALEVKGHMLASRPTSMTPSPAAAELTTLIEDGRVLMGGTIDLGDEQRVVRSEVIAGMWAQIEAVWPAAREIGVEYQWACFRPAHPDRLPVIDRVPSLSNAWLTSGHYKTGILNGAATGRALAEWIRSAEQPTEVAAFNLARLFSPTA